jgi:mannose-6-phosphate isomerase-like protein (cupin superfamily)
MRAIIRRSDDREFITPERCWILESWNEPTDPTLSIARARVEPGVTTQPHRLRGVDERYIVVAGHGVARIGDLKPERVGPGDILAIPAGTSQQVTNDGVTDLVFYCVCSPPFTPDCYESLD